MANAHASCFWLWLFVLLAGGCQSLWGGTLTENPRNCIGNPQVCTSEERCNEVTEACEKLPTCVQAPTLCQPTQACNAVTGQCETRTFVLGQPDVQSNLNLAYGMSNPRGVLLIPGSGGKSKLLVADSSNQRVLIWNEVPTVNRPADAVLGQPDVHTVNVAGPYSGVDEHSMSSPWALASDGTQLLVADQLLNRLLIWNQIPSQPSGGEPFPASALWGQPDFISSLPNASKSAVNGLGVSQPRIFGNASVGYFVADTQNNRVLVFKSAPRSFADPPDFVIGQPDFTTNQASTTASGLRLPRAVYCDTQTLLVSDTLNHRILAFSPTLSANGPTATMVFGQADFTSGSVNRGSSSSTADSLYGPTGMWMVNSTTLFVADQSNHRVLRYSLPITSADLVLGQAGFTSNQINRGNRGGAPAANTMNFPIDVVSDGTRLAVADTANNRVLIWNSLPSQNGQPADVVLGHPDGASTDQAPSTSGLLFRNPGYVVSDGVRLFIADTGSHRVLIWNQLPLAGTTPPDVVLGQPDFVSRTGNMGLNTPTAATLGNPRGIAIEKGRLLVADSGNNRILIWKEIPTQNAAPADLVLGQPNFTTAAAQPPSGGLNAPYDIRVEQGRLYVADAGNNRILIFSNPFAVGAVPDGVLGQPDLATVTSNYGGRSASSLAGPQAVFFVDGKLLVADRNNHRVLIWNSVPIGNLTAADVVVGQIDFMSNSTRSDRTHLNSPSGLLVNDGRLYIASSNQNRVLYWNRVPTTNGYGADGVLGQDDFVSVSPNNPNLPPAERLSNPLALAAAADQLFIADGFNNRVVVRGSPR